MSFYATVADFEAYVEGWVTEDEPALERLLERAERDIDSVLGPWAVEGNGLKFGAPAGANEKGLLDYQRDALTRAVCAQAEYRYEMGEDFFVRAQHESVSGPDFSHRGTLPRIGPKVADELRGSGLVISGARAVP